MMELYLIFDMSKKVKFTISGGTLTSCDQIAAVKLANPKASNTLLFRIVRPFASVGPITPPDPPEEQLIPITIECASAGATYGNPSVHCSFIMSNSLNYAERLLGIWGTDDEVESFPMDESGSMYVCDDIEATIEQAHQYGALPIELNNCEFYVFVISQTPTQTLYFISDEINGTTLVAGTTIHVTESWVPRAMQA